MNLYRKIILITGLILLIAIGINTVIETQFFSKEYTKIIESQSMVIGETLKLQLERLFSLGIPLDELVGFEEQCQDLAKKYKDVKAAMVIDLKGKVIFHNDSSNQNKTIEKANILQYLAKKEYSSQVIRDQIERDYDAVIPVRNLDDALEALVVVEYSEEIGEKIKITIINSIAVTLLSLIIAIVFLFLSINFWIKKPLKKLMSAIQKIREKGIDSKGRVEVHSKDELGSLANSFNQMIEDLQKTTVSQDKLIKEISERKKAEAYLKTIFNSIQAGIVLIEPHSHKIIDINPVAVKMFGMPKEKIIDAVCHKFICPADVGKCPITDLGQTVDNSERVLINAKGQKIPILKTVITVSLGGQQYLLESFVDISKHKKMEEERERLIKELEEERELLKRQKQELEDSRRAIKNVAEDLKESKDILEYQKKSLEAINKELDDFTYIVSHDLKEPLRSIDAYSKFIAEDFQDKLNEDGRHYLERMRSNTERMKKLIEDLLEISRLKKKGSTIEEVEAGELIGEVKMRLEYAINQKGVEITIKDKLPKIFCDRLRLTEVFLNLISNAVKFNDKPKPIIEIGCNSKGDFYEFYVKDNGIGIKEEYFDKIFEIFQRLGKREDNEGTGAGLTIVKKIIQMHRGNIWLESKIGEGATFYFTIPKEKSMVLGKKLIGEILIERKLITEEEIKKALEEQEKKNIEMTGDKQD